MSRLELTRIAATARGPRVQVAVLDLVEVRVGQKGQTAGDLGGVAPREDLVDPLRHGVPERRLVPLVPQEPEYQPPYAGRGRSLPCGAGRARRSARSGGARPGPYGSSGRPCRGCSLPLVGPLPFRTVASELQQRPLGLEEPLVAAREEAGRDHVSSSRRREPSGSSRRRGQCVGVELRRRLRDVAVLLQAAQETGDRRHPPVVGNRCQYRGHIRAGRRRPGRRGSRAPASGGERGDQWAARRIAPELGSWSSAR